MLFIVIQRPMTSLPMPVYAYNYEAIRFYMIFVTLENYIPLTYVLFVIVNPIEYNVVSMCNKRTVSSILILSTCLHFVNYPTNPSVLAQTTISL